MQEWQKISSDSRNDIINKNCQTSAKRRGNASRTQKNVRFRPNPVATYLVPPPPPSIPNHRCSPQNQHYPHYQQEPSLFHLHLHLQDITLHISPHGVNLRI